MIAIAVVAVSYASAIHATGSIGPYINAIRVHGEYISRVDSFRSPDRPPLWRLIDRFFIKQYESPGLSIATSVFVLISIIGAIRARDRSMLFNAATFGPFAIAAWLMLDRYSVSRFSIGYAPMFAIFAADGIANVARALSPRGSRRRRWPRTGRRPRRPSVRGRARGSRTRPAPDSAGAARR